MPSSEPAAVPPQLSPGRRRAFQAIVFVVIFGLAEVITRFWFGAAANADWELLRRRMAGVPMAAIMMCDGQPYLNYAPIPGYRQGGELGHNEHGYRGRAVPFDKSPRVARVLCVGGSTTYSTGVLKASDSYPANLERILNENPPAGYDRVEVMNGGLPYGSTAELLTHYHFKFRWFRPDLVVINTGGVDADATARPHYQPDYSHWRRQPHVEPPLPPYTRWLMRSRVVALAAILLVHGQPPSRFATLLTAKSGEDYVPKAHWFPDRAVAQQTELPDELYAFRVNLLRLLDEIRDDGAKAVLVPFRAAPPEAGRGEYDEQMWAGFRRNEQELYELAEQLDLPIAPFPADTIASDSWVDRAHVDERGTRAKAAHIAPFVAKALAR